MKKKKNENILEKVSTMMDIEAVQVLLKNMEELLIRAGISRKSIEQSIKVGETKIVELRKYLISLYEKEYREYKRIYHLLPAHAWEHYKLLEIEDMAEQAHLKIRGDELKKAWKNRPRKERK